MGDATIPARRSASGRRGGPSRNSTCAPAAPLAASLLVLAVACSAPGADGAEPGPRPDAAPGLVVLVVVDQLSADLLDRYADLWTGGFRRLLDEGLVFRNATHDHAFTETAPGHATLATGVVPARHGIVANNWREPDGDGGWRGRYSVGDPDAAIVGGAGGGRGPANLRRDGLADWIRAANPSAGVVSVSRKDRSAVAMAGRAEGAHAYWISGDGRFVTSSWYRDRLPAWVEDANGAIRPRMLADTVWESVVPPELAGRTSPDTSDAEGRGGWSWFPHRAHAELDDPSSGALADWVLRTPAPDEAVLALSLEALEALDLGRGPGPDLLAVGFSQADYVGHRFGPWSREQLDNLLRLDRLLDSLLAALDERVGEGRWVLALSADHGVLPLPEDLRASGERGMRLARREVRAMARALEAAAAGAPGPAAVPEAVARAAESFDFVAEAYTHDEILTEPAADTFIALYRNALFEGRYAGLASTLGVELRLAPGALSGYPTAGTGHGSPHWYDRHVPLVFLGAGVSGGASDAAARTVDAAPTLATLAEIPIPSNLDGRSLTTPPGGG